MKPRRLLAVLVSGLNLAVILVLLLGSIPPLYAQPGHDLSSDSTSAMSVSEASTALGSLGMANDVPAGCCPRRRWVMLSRPSPCWLQPIGLSTSMRVYWHGMRTGRSASCRGSPLMSHWLLGNFWCWQERRLAT
jgi:hypothetical protein